MIFLNWTRLDFLFGTESCGFCALMKLFFSGIAVATLLKNGKIRVQNVQLAGKRKSRDEFIVLGYPRVALLHYVIETKYC